MNDLIQSYKSQLTMHTFGKSVRVFCINQFLISFLSGPRMITGWGESPVIITQPLIMKILSHTQTLGSQCSGFVNSLCPPKRRDTICIQALLQKCEGCVSSESKIYLVSFCNHCMYMYLFISWIKLH